MKVDKTLVASVALHVLVIGWGLVSFSSKAFESIPEESLPVDIISADQLAKVTAGMKTGKKENPKPLVDKVAEAKPVDDAVGKIAEKSPVVTDTTPPPQPQKPKERTFDQTKIAALLDKRDPTRQAATGETLNSNAALGLAKGKAADNSATWGALFKEQVERCWKKPYGGIESQNPEVAFTIKLKRDGTLEAMPAPEGTPATPYLRVYQESALRAIIECQPYNLPAAFFDEWKYFAPVFTERRT